MSIPVIDLTRLGTDRDTIVSELGCGLEALGFVAIVGHGIDEALLSRAYEATARACALPDSVKRHYERPDTDRQRGYTPFGLEHAKDSDTADLKEFWQVGRDLSEDHPLRRSGEVPTNAFPDEIPEFGETFRALYSELEVFAHGLLGLVGEYLERPPGFFERMVRDGNSVMRVIHYPPLGPDAPAGAVRAASHEDINLMTVLPVSTQPGLELLTREGQWMAVCPPPNVMVCDTGDMMALITGGRLPATTHRVVNPPDAPHRSRYSMPFFVHPHPDHVLRSPGSDDGVTARDFLKRRLVEIGVAGGR